MNPTQQCDATFKQAVLMACYDAISAAGFTRFRKKGVDWAFDGDFHCWVGLNSALESEHVDINPFVGVHVVPIEKLWTAVKVGKYPGKYSRAAATYARHMGELTPDEPMFRFTPHTDVDTEAGRLARLYSSAGLTYARSIAKYELLLPLLQGRVEMRGAYPEKVASCLYLMGRKKEAEDFVRQYLAKNQGYFEGFAVPFLKVLDHQENRVSSATN
jgi:hypothetical protein